MKSLSCFCVLAFCICIAGFPVRAQSSAGAQKNFSRQQSSLSNVEDSLQKQFEKLKLTWPPAAMYIRSFKYDRQLEIWVKNSLSSPYVLFKSYKVCIQSGTMGPKRMEGDYQVPEGFYYINEFNPNSVYHLSLGLNYPNASDRILSDSIRPGSAIYIHGNCVSTGCIPLGDFPIEEVYMLASAVRAEGQEFIPVHVFPVRYNVKSSLGYLNKAIEHDDYLKSFNANIRQAYDFFEAKKQLPVIMVNKKGEYVLN